MVFGELARVARKARFDSPELCLCLDTVFVGPLFLRPSPEMRYLKRFLVVVVFVVVAVSRPYCAACSTSGPFTFDINTHPF